MDKYNVKGLKRICSANRDIISSYNQFGRDELLKLLIEKKDRITIPEYIANNKENIIVRTQEDIR